ncbi:MAG: GxxExxY protein [Spirochaetales bacterium]|nr:GxxExxY protein [Spirochaetales bacterium]
MNENQVGTIIVELKLGYLLNFGEALMKDGITRIINGHL